MGSSINREVAVKASIEGADEVGQAAEKALGPWERRAASAKSAISGLGQSIGQSVQGMISDVGRVVTALGTLNFAEAANRYRSYSEAVARQSVVSGESVAGLKWKYADLTKYTLQSDEANAKLASSFQRATYDAKNVEKALAALGMEATATGKSNEEMVALGATMHDVLGVPNDQLGNELQRVRGIAESLGTVGGPAALQDQLQGVAGALGHVSLKTEQSRAEMEALVGLVGRGLNKGQAQQVQQRLLGFVTTGTEQLRHTLGMQYGDMYDEQGNVKDPGGLLLKIRENAKKRWGKRALEVLAQDQNLGPQGAAALMNLDAAELVKVSGAKSTRAQEAAVALGVSPEGKAIADKAKADAAQREDVGGPLAWLQNQYLSMSAKHPVLTAIGTRYGFDALSKIPGLVFGGGAAGGGGAATGGRAAGRGLLRNAAMALGAEGMIGLTAGIGTMLALGQATGELNEAMPGIRNETENALAGQRLGRARAIATSYERSKGSAAGFKKQAGSALLAQMAYDPGLSAFGQGLFEGQVPAALAQSGSASDKQLATLLEQLLAEMKKERPIKLEITNATEMDGLAVEQKGAPQ